MSGHQRAPVPVDFDDVTPAWVADALGIEVAGVTVEPFGAGTAFLGRLARVVVDHTTDLPGRFVLKLPTDDPGGRRVGRMLNTWQRESMFYDLLAPHVGDAVPAAFYNGADPERDRWALLLADFHPWTSGDQVAGATPAEARTAVEQLARIHAPWWGTPRTDLTGWLPGIDQPAVTGLQDAIVAAVPRFEDRYGDLLPPEPTARLRRFAPTVRAFLDELATTPLTVTHADYRVENLLFSPDGDRVAVIDWQTAMVSAGATDLSFFLATNLDVDHRRADEDELVALYIETLHAEGVDPALTRRVGEQYRTTMLWWMGMLANNLSTIDPPDERGRQLFEAMLTRLWTAVSDWT